MAEELRYDSVSLRYGSGAVVPEVTAEVDHTENMNAA